MEDAIVVGGGPCGLAAAIALQEKGLKPIVIEKGNIVDAIYRYPTHQQFFSTSDRLEIGGIPFITATRKPKRNDALAYYREVVKRKNINVFPFEKVVKIERNADRRFVVHTQKRGERTATYETPYVIIATGYYDSPNELGVKGEDLDKVFHYFKEAHPFFRQKVAVIGGRNSAVDAAMELHRAGAEVTVLYRGEDYSESIKPWILPEFAALVKKGEIMMEFRAQVREITHDALKYTVNSMTKRIENDFVFAMTGYHPDHSFLREIGVAIDKNTGRPKYDEMTMETNVSGIFIAGVIAAGNNANEIFIENGRFHGRRIADEIMRRLSLTY